MPEACILRCVNVKCQQFQIISSILPSADDYIQCEFCNRRQPAKAYVHPVGGHTLRSYNKMELKEILEELKSKHVTPGAKRITAALQAAKPDTANKAVKAYSTASKTADHAGVPGNFAAQCFVPADVQPGDTLELKCGPRVVRVIVDNIGQATETASSK